ncbi:MAG: hypothetical protein U0359_36125 [Byssovorax sp.]
MRVPLVSALLLALVAVGCAEAPSGAPPLARLDPRETLALSPRALSHLTAAERDNLRKRLDLALRAEATDPPARARDPAAVPVAPVVALAVAPAVRAALALDLDRREASKLPLLAASVEGDLVTVLPVASLFAPATAAPGAPELRFDPVLAEGLSPSKDTIARLAAALPARAGREPIEVVIVPSMPFALLYAPAADRLFLNPVVLELSDAAEDRAFAEHGEGTREMVRRCGEGSSDLACLNEAIALRTVERCVTRIDPACVPAAPATVGAVIAARPSCAFLIQTCSVEPVLDSPCAGAGPLGTPCSVAGSEGGSICGREVGKACGSVCMSCGITAQCDRDCTNICGHACASECARGCEDNCADCGARCGGDASRSCTKTCGETGSRHGGMLDEALEKSPDRLPPAPPIAPRRAPPSRPLVVTAARDALTFLLPPLVFALLFRRGNKARGAQGGAPAGWTR